MSQSLCCKSYSDVPHSNTQRWKTLQMPSIVPNPFKKTQAWRTTSINTKVKTPKVEVLSQRRSVWSYTIKCTRVKCHRGASSVSKHSLGLKSWPIAHTCMVNFIHTRAKEWWARKPHQPKDFILLAILNVPLNVACKTAFLKKDFGWCSCF